MCICYYRFRCHKLLTSNFVMQNVFLCNRLWKRSRWSEHHTFHFFQLIRKRESLKCEIAGSLHRHVHWGSYLRRIMYKLKPMARKQPLEYWSNLSAKFDKFFWVYNVSIAKRLRYPFLVGRGSKVCALGLAPELELTKSVGEPPSS